MSRKPSLFASAKGDVLSGIIVFLIALPLCLGIAQASNAPLLSGIVSGIIGGVVIGLLSKSHVSVSGPAAGLVAIVLVAIQQLGSFNVFLCAVVVAGAIQLLLGIFKAGGIAGYFPSNVITGMLAGIGLTIIIQQIPDALGTVKGKGLADYFAAFSYILPGSAIIALLGLLILGLWELKSLGRVRLIPAGLLVVVVGTLLNQLFKRFAPGLHISEGQLVQLPVPENAAAFFSQFALPDLSGFANPLVWQTGIVIAVVASIETLLCIEATDKMDPLKRQTSGNSELKAQGIGNMISGLVGGLPITSVIVRSSANINAGARTKLSTIVHGILLFVCVATVPFILNLIPKATLAAILIFTGYKLCKPSMIRRMWHSGAAQFLPFAVTAIGVVALDLLKGVGIGLILAIIYLLRNNMKVSYFFQRKVYADREIVRLNLAQEVSFLNKTIIKKTLTSLPDNTELIIDANGAAYIDYDVLELIKEFQATEAQARQIKVVLCGFKNLYRLAPLQRNPDPEAAVDEPPLRVSAGKHRKLLKQLSEA